MISSSIALKVSLKHLAEQLTEVRHCTRLSYVRSGKLVGSRIKLCSQFWKEVKKITEAVG